MKSAGKSLSLWHIFVIKFFLLVLFNQLSSLIRLSAPSLFSSVPLFLPLCVTQQPIFWANFSVSWFQKRYENLDFWTHIQVSFEFFLIFSKNLRRKIMNECTFSGTFKANSWPCVHILTFLGEVFGKFQRCQCPQSLGIASCAQKLICCDATNKKQIF